MLKKINNKYVITHYEKINEIINLIKSKDLSETKILDFKKYLDITDLLEKLPVLKAEYTAEEIIQFNFDILNNLAQFIDIKSQIKDINSLMFKMEELLIIPKSEAKLILEKNHNFKLINLFQLHDLAEKIRYNIAEEIKSDLLIQKHGLIPVSEFIKMTPAKNSTIIKIKGNSYFTSNNIYNVYDEFKGISKKIQKIQHVNVNGIYDKSEIVMGDLNNIYETLDGEYYRKLSTNDKNISLISSIARGYNKKLYVEPQEFTKINLQKIEDNFIEKYKNIIALINPKNYVTNKSQIVSNIVEALSNFKYDIYLEKEFKFALYMEDLRLQNIIKNIDLYEDFKYEVLNKEKNFILKFIKKIKINEYRKEISRQTSKVTTSQN